MRSTTGKYYINLDHVRAFAVFLVFVWHFNHFENGNVQSPLVFPLSILTEGHAGVSIFLTLSGYLFAKLLDSKKIDYRNFMRNRMLRLFPLLVFVLVVGFIRVLGNRALELVNLKSIAKGVLWPTLPNGGWSITVEMHFYLLLPFFLIIFLKKRIAFSVFVILGMFAVRYFEYRIGSDIYFRAYYTILGRFDQFALGILAFRFAVRIPKRKTFGAAVSLLFLLYFYLFDYLGGVYGPFRFGDISWMWLFELTIEGFFFAILIGWYDKQVIPANMFTTFIAKIGQWSYSIYLLHCFFVFSIPTWMDQNLMNISNSYIKILAAMVSFFLFLPIAVVSYQLLERPFFKFRRNYIK